MIFDAHQHFWKYTPSEYPWIDESMHELKRDFLPSDLVTELKSLNIHGTVAVQARQSLEETSWLLQLAEEFDFIKGVVGWLDLCSSQIESQLEEYAKHPKLVGVRHVVHDEPDDRFMARSDFRRGISLLSRFNLSYDLLIFPKHLRLSIDLVDRFPDQIFIIDHIAKPEIKNGLRSPWDKEIRKLAERRNVFCKLSGLVTEADWQTWKAEEFKFYLDVVFEAFGPERLMIGSDWPVCTVAGSYNKIMSVLFDYLEQFKSEVKSGVLYRNCMRAYSL